MKRYTFWGYFLKNMLGISILVIALPIHASERSVASGFVVTYFQYLLKKMDKFKFLMPKSIKKIYNAFDLLNGYRTKGFNWQSNRFNYAKNPRIAQILPNSYRSSLFFKKN